MRDESTSNYISYKFGRDRADSFWMARSVNYPVGSRICTHPLDWAMGQPGGLSGNCISIFLSQQYADEVLTIDVLVAWIYL